jgi:hypothetical protein
MNQKLCSLGYTSQRLQRPVSQIESAIGELAIEPIITLNGVPYFDQADETRISDCLVEREVAAIRRRVCQPVKG